MKLKTVKTASKRTIISSTGKVLRRKASAQHLCGGKSKRTLRGTGKTAQYSKSDSKKIKRLIPYR